MEKIEGNERAQMEKEENIDDFEWIESPEEKEEERQRHLQRKQRIEEMKRKKRQAVLFQRCVLVGCACLLLTVGFGIGTWIRTAMRKTPEVSDLSKTPDQQEGNGGAMVAEAAPDGDSSLGDQENLQGGGFSELRNEEGSGLDGEAASGGAGAQGESGESQSRVETPEQTQAPLPEAFEASSTAATAGFGEDIVSQYGVLINVQDQVILAGKEYKNRINPASMTKILTVLTAADLLGITDGTEAVLDDTFVMTIEITDYSYVNDCSNVGFSVGEVLSVKDLFYGTILPSGADAAVGLAVYAAGSHEAFVERMNEKLEEMGMAGTTHFTNCVGIYDESHYSTVYDIAMILKAAADNPFLRQVLSAHTYNTSLTEEHPEGILLSNWFLRRIEDRDTHGEVLCGKTGFVNQSGSCAASLAVDKDGREYLCVTAGSSSSWQCIDDQNMLYAKYLPEE